AWGTLRAARRESADQDGEKPSRKARPGFDRKPRWSAERRAGRRHRPVIAGEPEIGPTARRATGAAFRTSACRRSAPLMRGHKTTAPPRRKEQGQRSVGLFSEDRGRMTEDGRQPLVFSTATTRPRSIA